MALNEFYVFYIYEEPHLLLIAEIKTVFVFFSTLFVARNLQTIFRTKNKDLQVEKKTAEH